MPNNAARYQRNQRNNPYVTDGLAVRLHHSAAGLAWRWRTELALLTLTIAAVWRLALLITIIWAAVVLAAFISILLAVPVYAPVHRPPVLVRADPASYPPAVLRSPAAHPVGADPAGAVDPADQGRRTCLAAVPGRHLRRGLPGPPRRAARRLLRRDARAAHNPRWSHLVTIDIVRRDTLAASNLIQSPLTKTPRVLPPPQEGEAA